MLKVWNAEVFHVVVDAFKDYSNSHIHYSGIICNMGKSFPISKEAATQAKSCVYFFISRSPPHQIYNNQLPGNFEAWKIPSSFEENEQIWRNLEKVFRDAGFTFWPSALLNLLRVSDYPSSSGFGYVIPSRGKEGVGSLKKILQFNYPVCSFCLSILFDHFV